MIVAITTSWAATFYIPTQVNNVTSNTTIYFETIAADGGTGKWYYDPSFTTESQTYTQITSTTDNGNPQGLTDGIATKSGASMAKVATNGNTFTSAKKVVHLHVKGVETVIAHGRAGSSGRGLAIVATEYNPDATDDYISTTGVVTFTRKSNSGSIIGQKTGLDATKEYIISIYGVSGDCYFYCAELIVPAGPTITTQPQSASYVTGDPIAALTVAATPNTSTFQWYSCDDADKTNAQPIEGETSTSYTPTAAGFYYVAVTDGGVTVNSDVAQITVSEATAPTIDVTGAPVGDVVVGTEVTLTATATGTPTPTIKWYDSTDTEVGEGETYNVSTATAGTYVYYAKATNGVEPDAQSANQTIVVKEKVATPTFTPNGAYFETSQEVAIASATDGATIQYSTDNGETWNSYTAAFTVTATTTVKAKATKDGYINSDEATATFTLVELDPQTDVTGAVTWDWADVTNTSAVELDKSPNVLNGVDVTFANIPAYGYTAVTGLSNQSSLLMNGQRAYNNANDSKHCQVNYLKFNTTVAGKVTVEYANTGGNAARTVNVNGTKGTQSVTDNSTYKTESFVVEAGEVEIKGVQVSDDADKMLRIRKVVFTPLQTASINLNASGYATYSSKYDFEYDGADAYGMKLSTDALVGTKVTSGKIKAGEGILFKGEAGATVTITETVGAEAIGENNNLVGSTDVTTGEVITAAPYENNYALSGDTFKRFTGSLVVNKAFFSTETPMGNSLQIIFEGEGEATAIDNVINDVNVNVPVKVIKNGKLYIGNYNVAGQQVK